LSCWGARPDGSETPSEKLLLVVNGQTVMKK
jgi:hypothetical protein